MKRQARAPRNRRFWRNIWRDRSGNVMSMFALMLVPTVGVLGMAGEASDRKSIV